MRESKLLELRRVQAENCGELNEKTVFINRVAKVVKGGRRFSFSALVVSGDTDGHVGFGLGKAQEVPDAIGKATDTARKNLIRVPLRDDTIPHEITGRYGAAKVVLRPAPPGTGIIAGAVVRSIVELAGVKNIRTKCVGSNNPHNVLHATLNGLLELREPEQVARQRSLSAEDMQYELPQ